MFYESLPELTSDLAFELRDILNERDGFYVDFGASNQSCSRYVDILFEDDDADISETFKVRFSDHDDRHGSDITIRIDRAVTETSDGYEIDEESRAGLINKALVAVDRFIGKIA